MISWGRLSQWPRQNSRARVAAVTQPTFRGGGAFTKFATRK